MTPEEIGAIRAMRLERAQRRAGLTACPLFSDSATRFFPSPFRFTGSHYTGHTAASTSKTRLTPPSTPCRSLVMKRKVIRLAKVENQHTKSVSKTPKIQSWPGLEKLKGVSCIQEYVGRGRCENCEKVVDVVWGPCHCDEYCEMTTWVCVECGSGMTPD